MTTPSDNLFDPADTIRSADAARLLGITRMRLTQIRQAGIVTPIVPHRGYAYRRADIVRLVVEREAKRSND